MANAPAAAQALAILKLLARRASPLPARTIARELGLPRSSVYHLLAVLSAEGFVGHLPEQRRYGLGIAAFELGFAYSRQAPLQWVARPVLARLVDRSTHSGHLAVLHGQESLYVIEERAVGRASLVTDVGIRLPAHLTASGLSMLAALPDSQVRALYPPRTPLVHRDGPGPTSTHQLRRLLAQARQNGYGEENGFVTPGLASVAAPVLNHIDHPVASVALTFPVHEVDDVARQALINQVCDGAQEISRRIRGSA